MYTGWQYTAGIGVKLEATGIPGTALSKFGLQPDDIIQKVNGEPTLTPGQLFKTLREVPEDAQVQLLTARFAPMEHLRISIQHREELQDYLSQPGLKLVRGHPLRAEGFLKHYFPYSEVLVLIGLLVWGLCISGGDVTTGARVALFLAFLAITVAVSLTLTRISL